MLQKIIIITTALVGTMPSQTVGSGIDSIRIGMSQAAVGAALEGRSKVAKIVDSRDSSIVNWTFADSTGINGITFKNGRVVAVDTHTSSYMGDAREAVKKIYALLYGLTKPGVSNERSAPATIVLREYPNLAGGEPLRRIELQIGDRHVDLTLFEPGDNNLALVGQGVGHAPVPGGE